MSSFKEIIGKSALAVSAVATLALAERVADPIDIHAQDYTIEGPSHPSDVFYASVNYYDAEGGKRDDRPGDALMITAMAGMLVYIVLKPDLKESLAQQPR